MAVKIKIKTKELKEISYKTLLVSTCENFKMSIIPKLREHNFIPHIFVSSLEEAHRELLEQSFDMVIFEKKFVDENTIDSAIEIANNSETGVLIFTEINYYEELTERLKKYGILVLPSSSVLQLVDITFNLMSATRERIRKMQKKTATLEEKMNEIRLVNRAKWILINHLNMTEETAHKFIEKQSMDRCRPKLEIAEEIIRTYN